MNHQQSFFTTPGETFDQGRQKFSAELSEKGEATCPCCNRRGKMHRLKIHATLAAMLCRLYRQSVEINGNPTGWVHLKFFKINTRSGHDFSIVKHWGVAESLAADMTDDKASSGSWRLTEKGKLWIEQQSSIRKNLWVFDDKVMVESDTYISIVEALNDRFSYWDLTGRQIGEKVL